MQTRKRTRLAGYDYSRTGTYFVTICLQDRTPLLGRVEAHDLRHSRFGEIVVDEIACLATRFTGINLDMALVMPDHAHLLIGLGTQLRSLGTIVGSLKTRSAREINRLRNTTGTAVWQRGFHDHVIRDEADLERVREYIATNPIRWSLRHGQTAGP